MKHIDLTEKEIEGVIDHADGSVTLAKLAPDALAQDHRDLANKEIGGVIDHLPNSITTEKLAFDINAVSKNFNAKYASGIYLHRHVTGAYVDLNPGEIHWSGADLYDNENYIIALAMYSATRPASLGQLIAGLYTGPNEKPRVWTQNIGAEKLFGCRFIAYHVQTIE